MHINYPSGITLLSTTFYKLCSIPLNSYIMLFSSLKRTWKKNITYKNYASKFWLTSPKLVYLQFGMGVYRSAGL